MLVLQRGIKERRSSETMLIAHRAVEFSLYIDTPWGYVSGVRLYYNSGAINELWPSAGISGGMLLLGKPRVELMAVKIRFVVLYERLFDFCKVFHELNEN